MSMTQVPSFFRGAATPLIGHPAAQFDSTHRQVGPPPPSISASVPPPSSSSSSAVVTTSGRDYISSTTAGRLDAANDSCIDDGSVSGSGVRGSLTATYDVTTPTALGYFASSSSSSYGLEAPFGSECSGSSSSVAAGPLHYATRAASVCGGDALTQSAGPHVDGRGSAATSPSYGSGFASTSGLYALAEPGPDTALQPTVYRRPFTSAKPPYSYISLITMAIQVANNFYHETTRGLQVSNEIKDCKIFADMR